MAFGDLGLGTAAVDLRQHWLAASRCMWGLFLVFYFDRSILGCRYCQIASRKLSQVLWGCLCWSHLHFK